ncbi:unnamed protein product [Amoebophrya sp. A25]|nr:unnamed protein product [Amoebophrya sp. A25]|eukprot:GSA25T00000554001.1
MSVAAPPRLPPIGHHAESTSQIAKANGTKWSNHSQFNRDPDIWIGVADVVIWQLAKDALFSSSGAKGSKGSSSIRVWSCGCSSGEEVYYMRMMWIKRFKEIFPEVELRVLGTDLSPDCIVACNRGQYEHHSVSVLPKEWQDQFFDPLNLRPLQSLVVHEQAVNRDHSFFAKPLAGNASAVAEAFRAARREKFEGAGSANGNSTSRRVRQDSVIRRGVEFVQQDNRKEMPDETFDLITCRYSLVLYTKHDLWGALVRLIERLRVGGFLVVGKTESLPLGFADRFNLVRVLHPAGIFQMDSNVTWGSQSYDATQRSGDQIPGVYQKMSAADRREKREEQTAQLNAAEQQQRQQQLQMMNKTSSSVSMIKAETSAAAGSALEVAAKLKQVAIAEASKTVSATNPRGLQQLEEQSTSAGSSDERSNNGSSDRVGGKLAGHRSASMPAHSTAEQKNGRSSALSSPRRGASKAAATSSSDDAAFGTTSSNTTTSSSDASKPSGFQSSWDTLRRSASMVSFGSGDVTGKRAQDVAAIASKVRVPLKKPVFFVPSEDKSTNDARLQCGTYGVFLRRHRGGQQPDWLRNKVGAAASIGRPRVPMLDRSKEILHRKRVMLNSTEELTERVDPKAVLQKSIDVYSREINKHRTGVGAAAHNSKQTTTASGTANNNKSIETGVSRPFTPSKTTSSLSTSETKTTSYGSPNRAASEAREGSSPARAVAPATRSTSVTEKNNTSSSAKGVLAPNSSVATGAATSEYHYDANGRRVYLKSAEQRNYEKGIKDKTAANRGEFMGAAEARGRGTDKSDSDDAGEGDSSTKKRLATTSPYRSRPADNTTSTTKTKTVPSTSSDDAASVNRAQGMQRSASCELTSANMKAAATSVEERGYSKEKPGTPSGGLTRSSSTSSLSGSLATGSNNLTSSKTTSKTTSGQTTTLASYLATRNTSKPAGWTSLKGAASGDSGAKKASSSMQSKSSATNCIGKNKSSVSTARNEAEIVANLTSRQRPDRPPTPLRDSRGASRLMRMREREEAAAPLGKTSSAAALFGFGSEDNTNNKADGLSGVTTSSGTSSTGAGGGKQLFLDQYSQVYPWAKDLLALDEDRLWAAATLGEQGFQHARAQSPRRHKDSTEDQDKNRSSYSGLTSTGIPSSSNAARNKVLLKPAKVGMVIDHRNNSSSAETSNIYGGASQVPGAQRGPSYANARMVGGTAFGGESSIGDVYTPAGGVRSLRPPKDRPHSPTTKLLMKNHDDLTNLLGNNKGVRDAFAGGTREIFSRGNGNVGR